MLDRQALHIAWPFNLACAADVEVSHPHLTLEVLLLSEINSFVETVLWLVLK